MGDGVAACGCAGRCFLDQPARIEARNHRDLFEALRTPIDRLLRHRRCFFVLEDPRRHRYVQVRVDGG
jgi:hypothetical protein